MNALSKGVFPGNIKEDKAKKEKGVYRRQSTLCEHNGTQASVTYSVFN